MRKACPSMQKLKMLAGNDARVLIEELSPETQGMILEAKQKLLGWNGCGEAFASEIALKLAIVIGEGKNDATDRSTPTS